MTAQVVYIRFPALDDRGVVLNGVLVYYQDSEWSNRGITARHIADDIAQALGVPEVREVNVRLEGDGGPTDITVPEEWDWSEVVERSLAFLKGAGGEPPAPFQGSFYIDVPDPLTIGQEENSWRNVHVAESREAAVAWIRENVGWCDEEGRVSLLTPGQQARQEEAAAAPPPPVGE